MRRRYRVLLIVAIVALVGCEDLAQLLPQQAEESLPSAYVAPTAEPTFPPTMTTAARILARGELVVGVRYDLEPLSYITPDSELAGLEIDLARELARRWLGSSESVRFRQVRSDSAYDHLANGSVDIVLAGIVHTQGDESRADFSPSYFSNGMALLTYPDTGVQTVNDLQGHRVGVVTWTGSLARLQAAVPVSTTYVTYDNTLDLIDGLRDRQIDVYGDQRHRLERVRRATDGTGIVGQFQWEPLAMIYRQDDPFFDNLVQLTFQDLSRDGTLEAIYARWLPGAPRPAVNLLPGSAAQPALASSPQELSTLDVIARIRSRGSLAVGYVLDRWPYSGDRADGVPTGFEVRLAEYLAETWLGNRQAVTLVPVSADDALLRLEAGELDLLVGGWIHTRESEIDVDHSLAILNDGVSILALASAPADDLSQLGGRTAGFVNGSSAAAAVDALAQGIGFATRGYPSWEAAIAALDGGEIGAVLAERRPALELAFHDERYVVSGQPLTYRPISLVLPQGDSGFRDLVNLTLLRLQSRGTYQDLYKLWFDADAPALETWPGAPAIPLIITP